MDGAQDIGFSQDRAVTLDGSVLSHRGMMLMAYQRTAHVSRRARLSWEAGDPSILDAEVTARRDEIFARVVADIANEHRPVRAWLQAPGRAPGSVIDIGCGTGIADALLRCDHDVQVTLVDIEETPGQYHFWQAEGSGYASLDEAVAFLVANGCAPDRIRAINPRKTPGAMADLSADLVTSFFSCGFHYPIGEYVDLMCQTVEAGGAVILDLRGRYHSTPDAALSRLMAASRQEVLFEMEKARRVVFYRD